VVESKFASGLKDIAKGLGADLYGVAPPCVDSSWLARHEKWIARGYHGDMTYLAREPARRYDARHLLPECSSVVVIGVSYFTTDPAASDAPSPRVSRYAWGEDYHDVLGDKLRALGAWLDARVPEHRWKACVDHSPLCEKSFAVAAGLGWEGRNSLLLNDRYGSYFFLGLLLSSAKLEQDSPLIADCGTCSRCIQSCPTNALLGPGILDARRCISYLTTESKSPPGPDDKLHGWAYGCDVCQDVCPFNSALPASPESRFNRREWVGILAGEGDQDMSEGDFAARFNGTVIKRRRLERWQAQLRAALRG
jgi:epoxyqueuosine reductase